MLNRFSFFIISLLFIHAWLQPSPAIAATALIETSVQNDSTASNAYRLNPNIVPLAQYVELNLDPKEDAISGYTQITLNLAKPSTTLAFHSKGLIINSVKVLYKGQTLEAPYSAPNTFDIVTVSHPQIATFKGEAKLQISFTSHVRDDSNGLYRYQQGEQHYLFSQFQPMQARTLFPLLDEPSLKTRFRFRVTTPKHYQVLHSTPIAFTLEGRETQTFTFAETEKIPADVLALSVGKFDSINVDGLPMPSTFYTLPGKLEQAKDAIAMIKPLYQDLANYINIPLPYKKMDFLVVPEFESAGMENVGLIYLADAYVFGSSVDGKSGKAIGQLDALEKCDAAILIAHEIAHMWFGNLVTLAWWDDLWLNESFSDWIGIKFAAHHLNLPQCGALARQDSLLNDEAQRPLQRNIASYADVESYGQIVYEKGYAVLHMLESYLGEATFQRIIQQYLNAHLDGTVVAKDFFQLLDKENALVADMARGFVQQSAYPLVTLAPQNNQWVLSQTPILHTEQNTKHTEQTTQHTEQKAKPQTQRPEQQGQKEQQTQSRQWVIPITLRLQGRTHFKDFTFLLDKPSMPLPKEVVNSLARFDSPPLLIVDPYNTGYFRANVAQNQMDYYSKIGEFFQVSWLDNRQHLAKLGHITLNNVIEQEVSFLVNAVEAKQGVLINKLLNIIIDRFYETIPTALIPAYRHYLKQRLEPYIAHIDWTKPSATKHYNHWIELAAIHLQLPAPRLAIQAMSDELLQTTSTHRDHYAQLKVLAHFADDNTYSKMEQAYLNASGLNKRYLLNALGFVNNAQRMQRYYDFLLSDATKDDFIDYRFQFPFFNQSLRPAIFEYLASHTQQLHEHIELGSLQWFPFNFMTGCSQTVLKGMDRLLPRWQHLSGYIEKHTEIRAQVESCARSVTQQEPALMRFFAH